MKIIRKTKSVELLVNLFNESSNALSAVELTDRLKDKMNKTTIYRILEKLEQDGFVHSFIGIEGLKFYAKCTSCSSNNHIDTHPHFHCQRCGKLDCVKTEIHIPTIENRKVDFAQIILVGTCEKCL